MESGFDPEENGVIAATHRDYRKTAETVESALAAHPNLRMVYMANPSVPACAEVLRSRGLAEKVHILSHDCGPEIQELLKSGEVDFTMGRIWRISLIRRCLCFLRH